VAAIISIVETCRRLQIPIRNYLAAVLPGLADVPVNAWRSHADGLGRAESIARRSRFGRAGLL